MVLVYNTITDVQGVLGGPIQFFSISACKYFSVWDYNFTFLSVQIIQVVMKATIYNPQDGAGPE